MRTPQVSADLPHVVHIVESANAGVGRHVIELLEGIARLGQHQLDLIYSPQRADRRFLDRLPLLEELGVGTHTLILGSRLDPFRDAWATARLLNLLVDLQPVDLIHTHSGKAGVVGRMAAFLRGVPSVHTPNGLGLLSASSAFSRSVYRFAERVLGLTTSRLIAVSPEEAASVRDGQLARRDSCVVIPNGIPSELPASNTNLREELHVPAGEYLVGAVGRLVHQKDPELFVRAAIRILDSGFQRCHFVWIGDGPLARDMHRLIDGSKWAERIHLVGFREDAESCYEALDLFMLTSHYEGMSYSMLEAMRAGAAIVAPRVEGVASALGEEGVLVDSRDPGVWVTEVINLLNNPDRRAQLGRGAQMRFRQYFDVSRMVTRTVDVYAAVLNPSS